MSSENREKRRHSHGGHFLIPAGLLIGLGIGILAGYPASGVLIGLGCGFVLSACARKPEETTETDTSATGTTGTPDAACTGSNVSGANPCCNTSVTLAIIGIFIILVGIGISWAPPDFWKWGIPGFLILLGVWFVIQAYLRNH